VSKRNLGVRLESLELPLRRGLAAAQQLGVSGIQVDAAGDLLPDRLSQTGRRAFRQLLRSHSLELTALNCPLRRGLDSPENQEARIDHLRKVMSLAFDLGPRLVIVHAGPAPEDESAGDPPARLLTEALTALGRHGDRVGATLALQTGLEAPAVLTRFLDRLDTGGLGVNYDPAGLLLAAHDPYEAARVYRTRLVHVHARDARRATSIRAGQEMPLGQGDLDWMLLAAVLEEVAYQGWITIVRDSGAHRAADVAAGVSVLRRLIG
jgi:sugar phosphate isomerase/epimerase